MNKYFTALAAILIFILAPSLPAYATQIDLNDFFADPTVTVAPDGSSAVFAEDPPYFSVLLSNDPGLGDPEAIFAGPGQFLTFDYLFEEPPGNNDEFGAFVIDSTGASAGQAYEYFTQAPGSGTVSFDLSGLTSEPFIGFQFQLSSVFFDGETSSTVTVSNMTVSTVSPVPEPATVILVATGLVGLIGIGRKNRKIG